ncbi:hypothetical protein ACC809_36555, partial [Rhizobium johnstonii]
ADDVNELLHLMGRVDPMDLMRAPSWVPRVTLIGGQKVLEKFRAIVRNTMDIRLAKMKADRSSAPEDFLTGPSAVRRPSRRIGRRTSW